MQDVTFHLSFDTLRQWEGICSWFWVVESMQAILRCHIIREVCVTCFSIGGLFIESKRIISALLYGVHLCLYAQNNNNKTFRAKSEMAYISASFCSWWICGVCMHSLCGHNFCTVRCRIIAWWTLQSICAHASMWVCVQSALCISLSQRCHCLASGGFIKVLVFWGKKSFISPVAMCQHYSLSLSLSLSLSFTLCSRSHSLHPFPASTTLRWEIKRGIRQTTMACLMCGRLTCLMNPTSCLHVFPNAH